MLDSGSSGPVSSPDRVNFVLFLGKTLINSLNSLHTEVQMGTNKCNAGGNPISSRGRNIPAVVASSYRLR